MSRHRILRALAISAALAIATAVSGFDQPPPPPQVGPTEPGIARGTMSIGGVARTWARFAPSRHDARKPCMLVIALHGGLGKGEGMATLTEHGFERCAEDDDGVILYPDGIDQNWDDDRVGVDSTAHKQQIDDVGFIQELIKRTSAETAIDPQRIFVTGISNGAMMCYRLARELPRIFAAIAPVAGLLPEGAESKPWTEPVSVLLIEGSIDPFMPYRGGVVGSERLPRGRVLSAVETVRFLVAQDSLPEKAQPLAAPDGQDAMTWRGELYGPAEGGFAVASFEIEGGGHTWPGGRQYLPERIVGRTSRVDACTLIWSFFKRHPRR